MKVFGFLSQKTIKVQFSKFRKISMDFYFVPNNQYGGEKKVYFWSAEALIIRKNVLFSAKVKK